MKRFAFLLLTLSFALISFAGEVTEAEALQKAQRFWDKASISRRASRKAPELVLANKRDEFYVFNDRANGGYVVVSGENRMPDILGYSYEGCFDADNIPCNMQAWLEGYAEQVKYLRTHPEAKAAKRTAPGRGNVGPLLTSWYSQGKPYNDKCPEVDGKRCVTGCVATAMAQIMYYWQWPKQTTDVIPGYTTDELEIEMPALPVTTIDWDNILGQYKGYNYTEKQADAISTLMLLCGTSVYMNYTPDESSAGSCSTALPKYFDYDDILESVNRCNYSTEDWEQLIYDELKSKRPVYYDGSPKDGVGHAFVLDGYEDGYFHINWGWGGPESYALMTDTEGWKGYANGQSAVVGIQPVSADNPSRYAVLDNGTMTLYYDKKKFSRSGTVLPHIEEWRKNAWWVTECVIDESFANLKQRNMFNYFSGWRNMKSIKGLEYLNTSEVTDMGQMFNACESLTSLDLSGFKTDKVKNMYIMFSDCSNLTSLDVSGFKTDKVTDMSGMFFNCASLTSLDVSGFKTDNVTDMSGMFAHCFGLTELDVSGFKTDNVTDMSYMFYDCSDLKTIYASERWNMSNVTNAEKMFLECIHLIGGAGTTYNPESSIKPTTGNIIVENDWTGGFEGEYPYWYEFDNSQTDGSVTSDPDGIAINVGTLVGKYWEPQVMVADNFELDEDGYYKVVITAKYPTNGTLQINMGDWDNNQQTTIDIVSTSDFQENEVVFNNYPFSTTNGHLLFQCGDFKGTTILKNIQIWKMEYNINYSDGKYAHIDEGPSNPGYFTYKVPSGIHTIKTDDKVIKWYTLDGRRVNRPSKGLYIVNGKKYVVK